MLQSLTAPEEPSASPQPPPVEPWKRDSEEELPPSWTPQGRGEDTTPQEGEMPQTLAGAEERQSVAGGEPERRESWEEWQERRAVEGAAETSEGGQEGAGAGPSPVTGGGAARREEARLNEVTKDIRVSLWSCHGPPSWLYF